MITYYKNVFLLLTTVAVNVGCQYLLEEYAPTFGNYEPTKYSLAIEIPASTSGASYHKLQRRHSDDASILDLSKREENTRLEQIITDDTQGSSLFNRVRRGGVYGEKTIKSERKVPEVVNTDTSYPRTRYASRSRSRSNVSEPVKSETSTISPRSRNLSSRRRNDEASGSGNQKRIVKKESYAESYFAQPTQLKDVEYIENYNLNPVNVENIKFESNGQTFLHQLSSIQPQHFMNIKQQVYQSYPSSTPRSYEQQNSNSQVQEKLIINVPDEPQNLPQEKQKQIEQGFTYIHNQPHTQSRLENIQRFITSTESPRIVVQNLQAPVYDQHQPEIKPHFERAQYTTPEKQENYQRQNIRYTSPVYGSKKNPNEDSGIVQENGDIKYINYGYRQQNIQPQSPTYGQYNTQPNGYEQYSTQPNYGSNQYQTKINYNYNTNNNYPQITEAQIQPNDKLSSQNHYPAILVHINGKTGIPFYPTSKNIFSVPHEVDFNYEGIPLVDFNKKDKQEQQQHQHQNYEIEPSNSNEDFRKEVYKSHYGYEDDEEEESPNAQRRLYTGLTFHASSRNLYDGKTPSLRNPPPKLGDVIWQAGDPITDPQEILVRQLNETCAYIQFNETTPGNEDGSKPNIWQAGDYSAQNQEEELIRSVNITCENYTTDALSNFTSGYTIIDYCSQCVNQYIEGDYEYDINNNQNQNQENVFVNPFEQNYNTYYQPNQGQVEYQYYSDGSNIDPRLENGEIAGFYKRKRLASGQGNNSKKQ